MILGASDYSKIFQSTLPARGSDEGGEHLSLLAAPFQSTLPARGSDQSARRSIRQRRISIHAPRKGERQFPAEEKESA